MNLFLVWPDRALSVDIKDVACYYCDRKTRTACAQIFAPWQQATIEIMFAISLTITCSRYILYIMVLFFTHIRFVVNHIINTTPPERLQQHPLLLQRATPIAHSLCEGWTRHDLHILVTAPFCCNQKSQAAYARSFAPRQQATIEIMFAISLIIACSHYIYDGVILHAHPVRAESHNQRNTTWEVATTLTLT